METKLIRASIVISFFYAMGAYITWDFSWLNDIGEWDSVDRVLLAVLFFIILIVCVFFEDFLEAMDD